MVNVPPQVEVEEVPTTMPAGRVSVKPMPVRATVVLLLVMVKPSEEVWPTITVDGVKPLLSVGAPTTVNVAVLLVALPPVSVAEITPVVLFFTPAVVALT